MMACLPVLTHLCRDHILDVCGIMKEDLLRLRKQHDTATACFAGQDARGNEQGNGNTIRQKCRTRGIQREGSDMVATWQQEGNDKVTAGKGLLGPGRVRREEARTRWV